MDSDKLYASTMTEEDADVGEQARNMGREESQNG